MCYAFNKRNVVISWLEFCVLSCDFLDDYGMFCVALCVNVMIPWPSIFKAKKGFCDKKGFEAPLCKSSLSLRFLRIGYTSALGYGP